MIRSHLGCLSVHWSSTSYSWGPYSFHSCPSDIQSPALVDFLAQNVNFLTSAIVDSLDKDFLTLEHHLTKTSPYNYGTRMDIIYIQIYTGTNRLFIFITFVMDHSLSHRNKLSKRHVQFHGDNIVNICKTVPLLDVATTSPSGHPLHNHVEVLGTVFWPGTRHHRPTNDCWV